jgi:hypothetical protein
MKESLRGLLEKAVDYAGTFPPARLDLAAALARYAEHRDGRHAWMLGPFVLAAGKIPEFEALAGEVLPPASGDPWPLTLVLSEDVEADLARVEPLARRWSGRARVTAVEAPPLPEPRIPPAAGRVPAGVAAFFEAPLGSDLDGLIAAIASSGAAAKVRTGGLRPEAVPGAEELARFLAACARRRLPFKATAGLHHPLRSSRPVEPGGPEADMHGFLNLAVAAALLWAGKAGPEEARAALEERSAAAFRFDGGGLSWRHVRLGLGEIAGARGSFFRSFGSCSFEEPAAELEESFP